MINVINPKRRLSPARYKAKTRALTDDPEAGNETVKVLAKAKLLSQNSKVNLHRAVEKSHGWVHGRGLRRRKRRRLRHGLASWPGRDPGGH